ncbi:MAG: glutamine synthetase family protein, partial [Candidatus Eremiobacterota bacterium]
VKSSFKIIKFKNERIGFLIGKIYNKNGSRAKSDPRYVLEKVIKKCKSESGLKFLVGPEYEFFLFNSEDFNGNIYTDRVGYFNADPSDKGSDVRKNIVNVLTGCGVKFEKAHHEVTPSQHEINLCPEKPLKAADRTLLFSYITRKVAKEHGYHATFMPKPFDEQNRSAFHIHLSMQNMDGENMFYSADGPYNLSEVARQFIGGIMKYARETSIIMASIYNSYKAYIVEKEAPITIGWGIKNRSSMIRVPYFSRPDNMRIELRNPDPAGNVYLQIATFIEMGLQGIREKLDCGNPDTGSTYRKNKSIKVIDRHFLPKSMFEALVEAEQSDFMRKSLGKEIFEHYMYLKLAEWEEHRTLVTGREYKKYLSI